MRVVVAAALLIPVAVNQGSQRTQPFVPIGVVDDRPGNPKAGLTELIKLRFTVVGRRDAAAAPGGIRVDVLASPGGTAGATPLQVDDRIGIVSVGKDSAAVQVR